jgi:hypothetical protein
MTNPEVLTSSTRQEFSEVRMAKALEALINQSLQDASRQIPPIGEGTIYMICDPARALTLEARPIDNPGQKLPENNRSKDGTQIT